MSTIVTRAGKGSALTNAEVDANFTNLNTDKLEASALAPYLTAASAASTYLTQAAASADYQVKLVSGTNIKTVNGSSVLGSGNIQIDGGVTSFNTRTGAITLSSGDVTGALGFTPYNSSNPSNYIDQAGARSAISVTQNLTYDSSTGVITGPDLSGYLTSATAASTYQTQAGMSSYLTTATAASTYQTQAGMSSYLTTADAATTYQTQSGMSAYLTTSAAASTYQTQAGMASYQATLVSGTNIKTINGTSVLGSGDITIRAGVTTGKAIAMALVFGG